MLASVASKAFTRARAIRTSRPDRGRGAEPQEARAAEARLLGCSCGCVSTLVLSLLCVVQNYPYGTNRRCERPLQPLSSHLVLGSRLRWRRRSEDGDNQLAGSLWIKRLLLHQTSV